MSTRYILAVDNTLDPRIPKNKLSLGDSAGLFFNRATGSLTVSDGEYVRSIFTAGEDQHLELVTSDDDKTIRLNNRSYGAITAAVAGVEVKPSLGATSTAALTGLDVAPSVGDAVGGTSLIGLRADAFLQGLSGNMSGYVTGLHSTLDLGGAASTRTVTGAVSVVRISTNFPATMTYTGKKSVVVFEAPGDGQFDFLLDIASGHDTWIDTTASLGAQIGQIKIRVGATTRAIPYYATA